VRVRYLHSDIDTLERIEILRDLRLGEFDVLVGINLLREGISPRRILVTGNPIREVLDHHAAAIDRAAAAVLDRLSVQQGGYLLLTAHRAGNVDDPERLRALTQILAALPKPVLFPVHPRTRARLHDAGLLADLELLDGLVLCDPLGYVEFSALVCGARAVLTDSGGVQKEAYLAGVPCITLRSSTEWVETVDNGWNVLADLDVDRVLASLERTIPKNHPQLYGDGKAAERCVAAIGAL